MADVDDPVSAALFASAETDPDPPSAALLRQYEIFVGTSQALESRRQTANTFFQSVNVAMFGASGFLAFQLPDSSVGSWAIIVVALAGLVMCYAWRRMIRSFGQLNAGKFEVITALERRLGTPVFETEWKVLGEGKDPGKYVPFTKTEAIFPWVFSVLHLGMSVIVVLSMVGVIQP